MLPFSYGSPLTTLGKRFFAHGVMASGRQADKRLTVFRMSNATM